MTGNSVKLGIAAVSILYDIMLMVRSAVCRWCWCDGMVVHCCMLSSVAMPPQVQHYIIYPEGTAAVLPQQREGFKPIPVDDRDSLPMFVERRSNPAATTVQRSST